MRTNPAPAFVAKMLDAPPADGSPISSRGIFVALGGISTPAYVRIVLRQLVIAGHIIATGPNGQRVYRRIPIQASVQRVPVDGQSAPAKDLTHECA
jgi:hypothetical protein